MLTDQGQGVRRDLGGIAGDDLEVRQIIGRRQSRKRHHDGQMAKARIFAEHGEERVDHAVGKTFAEHDPVDIARIEMFGRRFDAQRADDAHAFAERNGKRRIGAAASDQKHRRIANRIDLGDRCFHRLIAQPAQDRGVQGSNPKRRAQTREQAVPIAVRLRKRNSVFRQCDLRLDHEQRKIRLEGCRFAWRAHRARRLRLCEAAARTIAGCNCATARDASAQVVSMTGNSRPSPSAAMNAGCLSSDTTMIGPCCRDIGNSDQHTRSLAARS